MIKNRNLKIILLALSTIALVTVYSLLQQALLQSTEKNRSGPITASSHFSFQKSVAPTINNKPEFISGLENLPDSFRGTQLDGDLEVDEQGNLIINHDIRSLFDYFLTSLGEENMDVIQRRIQAYILTHLTEPAATQAIQLLQDYLQLQSQVATMEPTVASLALSADFLADRLQQLSDLRRSILSNEVADAFYREEETYDRFTIEVIRLLETKHISGEEKTQRIEELQAQLPQELRVSLQASQQLAQLEKINKQVKNQSGSEQDLFQLRTELVGSEAAQRLAKLDIERQQWQERLDAWLNERQGILSSSQLSSMDREQLLTQMRGDQFNQKELIRVKALEKIHDQEPF